VHAVCFIRAEQNNLIIAPSKPCCFRCADVFVIADLTAAECHHLLMLLHEWDLAGTGRHSMTDVYTCLQLLTLVRLPSGALSGQGASHVSGLHLPERPDSRQSNATASSLATSTSAVCKGAANTGAGDVTGGSLGGSGRQQAKGSKRGAIGAAWEGMQGSGAAAGHTGSRGGLTLKEAYLKERVAALETELTQARSGTSTVRSKEVRVTGLSRRAPLQNMQCCCSSCQFAAEDMESHRHSSTRRCCSAAWP
jgi:hypothetical protein